LVLKESLRTRTRTRTRTRINITVNHARRQLNCYAHRQTGRCGRLRYTHCDDDDDELMTSVSVVTCSRGLLARCDLALTLSTNTSITNSPMTANATYDVISLRTALRAVRTVQHTASNHAPTRCSTPVSTA